MKDLAQEQQKNHFPLWDVDGRGKSIFQARHWSAPAVFGTRASFKTSTEPAELVVEDVQRRDEGVYRCRVDFRNQQTRSIRYNLTIIVKPVTINILKTDSPLVADKRYEVTCESAGSRPSAIITWYKGKRQLRRTKGENMGNVTISELSFVPTTEDDGKYITCRAENPNVTGLFLETSWKIDVVYPPIVHLSLGSTLNADDIKEGDDVYFECKVRANPPMRRLTWLHNDIVLLHNMSSRIIHSNQSLVLQKVTKQSAGIYRCSVVNSEGETVSNELHFRVQYAPTCKNDKIMVVGASRGETIDVICQIESDPPAKSYKWKFNNSGETIDMEAERFASSNGTLSILKYTPIAELDYGSLSCWAANDVGTQVNPCVFQLVAAGKPLAVKNCTLTNQTSSSVEIYCLPGFDGGLPQHFLLELYTENSLIPRYNVTAFAEPYFFLDNLETDVIFRMVVFAVNSKGKSNGVVLEEITFRDAEKRTGKLFIYPTDGDLAISPVLGILIGASITVIIIIVIVVVRVRRSPNGPQGMIEEKMPGVPGHCNTMSSTKPLLRSASPREMDEKDPDIIPAKYGAAEAAEDNRLLSLTGSQVFAHHDANVSLSYPTDVLVSQWTSPVSPVSIKQISQLTQSTYHQYSNPVAMVGTFPRDSRPKDLCLGNGNSSTLARTSDLELNGLAIKERLMANRLPESCV
ncbi:hypothetical protein HUJ04_013422 [Dendroctonus ponderosae]|nr:hypothetical protein HUJ04_013422 [Dendroctonus ponderosae]